MRQAEPAEEGVLLCRVAAIGRQWESAKCCRSVCWEMKRIWHFCAPREHLKFDSKGENKTKQHKTHGAKGFPFSLVACPRVWCREVTEGRMLAQETQNFICFSFFKAKDKYWKVRKNGKSLPSRNTIASF